MRPGSRGLSRARILSGASIFRSQFPWLPSFGAPFLRNCSACGQVTKWEIYPIPVASSGPTSRSQLKTSPFGVTILPAAPSRALYSTGSASQGMDFPAAVLIHTMGAPQPLHVDFFILPPALLHPSGRPFGPVGPWCLRMARNPSRTTGHLVSVQNPCSLAWPQAMLSEPQNLRCSIYVLPPISGLGSGW